MLCSEEVFTRSSQELWKSRGQRIRISLLVHDMLEDVSLKHQGLTPIVLQRAGQSDVRGFVECGDLKRQHLNKVFQTEADIRLF